MSIRALSSTMPESSNLSSLARFKLQLSSTARDSCSLHRWVLLKNSLLRSQPLTAAVPTSQKNNTPHSHSCLSEEDFEEVEEEEETDSFFFPDAENLFHGSGKDDVPASEAQWLDSLLETLVDEEGDLHVDTPVTSLLADEEEDEESPLSPLLSPMSSSDDLLEQPIVYFPTPIAVSYPAPSSPTLHAYANTVSPPDSSLDSHLPFLYGSVLPNYDDVEELPVPDAIEDTSDDESDAPVTPPFSNSTSTLDDSSSALPSPTRGQRLQPDVYVGTGPSYFFPFELDPLPFAESIPHHTYAADLYQEC
jgi:hypothetical protein